MERAQPFAPKLVAAFVSKGATKATVRKANAPTRDIILDITPPVEGKGGEPALCLACCAVPGPGLSCCGRGRGALLERPGAHTLALVAPALQPSPGTRSSASPWLAARPSPLSRLECRSRVARCVPRRAALGCMQAARRSAALDSALSPCPARLPPLPTPPHPAVGLQIRFVITPNQYAPGTYYGFVVHAMNGATPSAASNKISVET